MSGMQCTCVVFFLVNELIVGLFDVDVVDPCRRSTSRTTKPLSETSR